MADSNTSAGSMHGWPHGDLVHMHHPHWPHPHANDTDDSGQPLISTSAYMAILNIIFFLGILGNGLVFIIASDAFIRKFSYSVYLRALAISDTLVLITICTEDDLDHAGRLHTFKTSSVALCKLWTGLSSTVCMLSPWLVVQLSLDRYVGVVYPLKRASFCILKVAVISVVTLTAVVMVTRIPDLVFTTVMRYETSGEIEGCLPDTDRASYVHYTLFTNLVLASTIPCCLILGFNVRLLYALHKDLRLRMDVPEGVSLSRKVERTTVSLMFVSIMAFLTLLPRTLEDVIEIVWQIKYEAAVEAAMEANQTVPEKPYGLVLAGRSWPILNLIYLMNFGQNFYILVATSPRIRNLVRQKLFGRCCPAAEEATPIAGCVTTHTVDGEGEEYTMTHRLLSDDEF